MEREREESDITRQDDRTDGQSMTYQRDGQSEKRRVTGSN